MVRVALLLFLGLARGCGSEHQECAPATTICEECSCKITERTERCIRLIGCRTDRDCPAGTVCLEPRDDEPPLTGQLEQCTASVDGDKPWRCRLAADTFDRALIDGFVVNEFLLEPIEGTSAFSFSPPPESRFVACAMFGCRPDIRCGGVDLKGNPRREIVNYAECGLSGEPKVFVVSAQTGEAGNPLVFTPSFEKPATASPHTEASECTQAHVVTAHPDVLTQVSVGCWVYGETHLIAATRLAPVSPEQASSMKGLLSDCRDWPAESMGRSCLLTGADRPLVDAPLLGTCFASTCRPRCVTAADCPRAVASKSCRNPTATCLPAPDFGFLSVCDYSACDRNDFVDAVTGGGGQGP